MRTYRLSLWSSGPTEYRLHLEREGAQLPSWDRIKTTPTQEVREGFWTSTERSDRPNSSSTGNLLDTDTAGKPLFQTNGRQTPKEEEKKISATILTKEEGDKVIAKYEHIVGMPAAELLKRKKEGTAPDTFEAQLLATLASMRNPEH